MTFTHPRFGAFAMRGGWLTGAVDGVEVGLATADAAARVEACGALGAWIDLALPRVAARMQGEALWAGASIEALVSSLRVLAVHAGEEAALRLLLRWAGRVDVIGVVLPDGEVVRLEGHFDLARRQPGFDHRHLGRFDDRGTHYESSLGGVPVVVDLPEAVALLEPHDDLVTWARGIGPAAAAPLATCATRHWTRGDAPAVSAGLSLCRIEASWVDECITLHFTWGHPSRLDASVRVRSDPAPPGHRVDRPRLTVHPEQLVLAPLGSVTLREEDGARTHELSRDGVTVRFEDPDLAPRVQAVLEELGELGVAARAHAARSMHATWRRGWRTASDPDGVDALADRFTLRSVEVEADAIRCTFDDGGAFSGHLVVVERGDDGWGDAYLEG